QTHKDIPSLSTIWRVLRREGLVEPQRQKRPRSSLIRFEAQLPNECWQADVTSWRLASGEVVEILDLIDDHSRLHLGCDAYARVKAPDVVQSFQKAAELHGLPQSLLSDNGAVFVGGYRHGKVLLEYELERLHIVFKNSRPYHPQTCGKVERLHQTLKKFLAKQEPAENKKQLQRQLDRFAAYYNDVRPHRGVGRRTPAGVFAAREKAYPTGPRIDTLGYGVRPDKVSSSGNVTLRYRGRMHHIGVGKPYKGWRIILLVAGREIRILTLDGRQLHRLMLDPSKDYQPMP